MSWMVQDIKSFRPGKKKRIDYLQHSNILTYKCVCGNTYDNYLKIKEHKRTHLVRNEPIVLKKKNPKSESMSPLPRIVCDCNHNNGWHDIMGCLKKECECKTPAHYLEKQCRNRNKKNSHKKEFGINYVDPDNYFRKKDKL